MNRIKDLPEFERPYEKCLKYGANHLSDAELLSAILRTGTNGVSAYDLANNIIRANTSKNILSVMHLSKEELLKIKGVGNAKAVQILCISELARRISLERASLELKMNVPSSIANYYMEQLRHLDQEQLVVIFLDSKCNMIKDKVISKGSKNQSFVCNREILVEALKCDAVSIILLHNHPSGDPSPSSADIASTKKLKKACFLIGLSLLDHIIIGDRCYTSFIESNVDF
ncbi:MAG: DNA repair protein RadC [Eubacterium sp.]|nr:DNA repair protein RadC [Eubacterium sp.]